MATGMVIYPRQQKPILFFETGQVVLILPTTWTMKGFMDLLAHGQNLAGILPEAGVLLGFAAVFFIICIARFKYE
jgi:ABC-type multidrug transport system permease subunit